VLINAGEADDIVPGEMSLLINACAVARLSWRRCDKRDQRQTVITRKY